MCTLTIIPVRGGGPRGVRMAFSRDESRLRREAVPPRLHRFGGRCAVMPVDPESGGTWIALSDAGIALALMNMNPPYGGRGSVVQSRGGIIPCLLSCDSAGEMRERLKALPLSGFAPFRLVLMSAGAAEVFEHAGEGLAQSHATPGAGALLFTSSGLGDSVVEKPRRRLFEEMLLSAESASAQDAFHRHRWPDQPHISVAMARSDARTVSYTTIELSEHHARLAYFPDAPDQPVQPQVHVLRFNTLEHACL